MNFDGVFVVKKGQSMTLFNHTVPFAGARTSLCPPKPVGTRSRHARDSERSKAGALRSNAIQSRSAP